MIVALNTTDPLHLIYASVLHPERQVILNRDLANQILIGPDEGSVFSANNPTTVLIDPGASVVVDGTKDWWAIAIAGSPMVQTFPSVTQWTTPPAIAVNLTDLKNLPVLLSGGNQINPGVSNWTLGPFNFLGGGGYEIVLSGITNGQPFITDIQIRHTSGPTEFFTVTNWPNSDNQQVVIRGNLITGSFTLVGSSATSAYINAISGAAPVTAGAFFLSVYQTPRWVPRPMPKVFCHDAALSSPFGYSGHIIGFSSLSVPASGSVNAGLVPSYVGEAYVSGQAGSAAAVIQPFFRKFTVASGTGVLYNEWTVPGVSNGTFGAKIAMDSLLHRLDINNQTTTAGTMNEVDLIAAEYP